MLVKEANEITGGLSSPGKMPCKSFNLPALTTCPVGAILAQQKGTSCSYCYALKGRYVFPSVQAAMKKRLHKVVEAIDYIKQGDLWVRAMTTLISRQGPYFRWHDSGDIFSDGYMYLMERVIRCTPHTQHWVPTKEVDRVMKYKRMFTKNVVFRISG